MWRDPLIYYFHAETDFLHPDQDRAGRAIVYSAIETARARNQGFVIAGVSAAIGILTLPLLGIGVLTILVVLLSFLVAAVVVWEVWGAVGSPKTSLFA